MPKASAADTSASSRLSVSNCRMMRRRDAPMASRMPISRWRATARASSRLATFAHPIIRMRPNAKKSGVNSSMTSADSGTVPCLGSSDEVRGAAARQNVADRDWPRVPHEELRQRLAARHAGLQPSDDADVDVRLRGPAGRGGTGQGARAAPRSPVRRPRVRENLPASRRQPGTARRSPAPCG